MGERHWEFVRPPLPAAVFLDDDGAPIPYGERWGGDEPPPDAYSRVPHPERFAALHTVADALIDYLARTFDADADAAPGHAGDLHDFIYPACGCDACDETAERCADELECIISGVTSGGYTEWAGRSGNAGMRLEFEGGSIGGSGPVGAIPKDRLDNARARLAGLPDGWAPWPLRARKVP